jgi:hypothetical protein
MSDAPVGMKFETFEEMEAWIESQKEQSTSTSKKKTAKKKATSSKGGSKRTKASASSKKETPPDEGKTLTNNSAEFDKHVWSTVHFYRQEGDSLATVRNDAKEEATFRNENVLVFFHDHSFGEGCEKTCGQAKGSSSD